MITRRKLGTALALTGILLAILAVHTIDATDASLPRPAPQPEAPVPPPAAVAHVTLPPPPVAAPRTITPLKAQAVPASQAHPVTPLKPAPVAMTSETTVTPLPPREPQPAPVREKTEPRQITPLAPAPRPAPEAAPQSPPRTPLKATPPPAQPADPVKAAESPDTDAVPDETLRRAGRPLLRLLEHGHGPAVEIAWPGDRRARAHLHRLFSQCYGMRVALIDAAGRLFDAQSAPGTPWAINTDRFSGFIRQSSGGIALEERQAVMRIRARHGLDVDAATVRIFPRRADALLLGGLSRLVPDYRKAKRIQARYHLADNRVRIDAIRVDGAPVAGAIDLTRASRRGCIL